MAYPTMFFLNDPLEVLCDHIFTEMRVTRPISLTLRFEPHQGFFCTTWMVSRIFLKKKGSDAVR